MPLVPVDTPKTLVTYEILIGDAETDITSDFGVLGISVESHTWLSCLCALGEYFYHVNLRTPQWIGYIFQRPESHRWHHIECRLRVQRRSYCEQCRQ